MIISLSGRIGSGKDTVGKLLQALLFQQDYNQNGRIKLSPVEQIQGQLYLHQGWPIKKWASALRKVSAILLGMDEAFLYTEEFKQMVLPEEWSRKWVDELNHYRGRYDTWPESFEKGQELIPMTGRKFLQLLGTNAVRNKLHENAWVNALMSEYKFYYKEGTDMIMNDGSIVHNQAIPNWIITDTRFPNELQAVKDRGGITINIKREYYSFEDGNHCWYDREDRMGWVSRNNSTFYTKKQSYEYYQQLLKNELHISETALDDAEFDYVINNNGTLEELAEKLKPIISKLNENGNYSTDRKT